jgi:predicted nucleotidyltransferase
VLSETMVMNAARRLASAASQPARIIVFGSYARGEADDDSDLDLLVVEPTLPDKAGEYLKLREALGPMPVGVDLLLFSLGDFERRSQVPGTLPYWAVKEGKVLYESPA